MTLKNCRCITSPTWSNGVSSKSLARENSSTRNNACKDHGSDLTMDDGIFKGLKVLDCASFIAAPAAATVLSDFGAEVIKIEPPGRGDPYRALPQLAGNPSSPHNYAWILESRNKKSIALDLTKLDAREV